MRDILSELEKPGRDPRPEFKTATFRDGVESLTDLQPGMVLEGVVTNVAAFGAFVDIGVHQDGLVHVSALAHTFVKDPHEVVKAGQIVKVKVLAVDVPRQRISLTMRIDDAPVAASSSEPRAGAMRDASEDVRRVSRQCRLGSSNQRARLRWRWHGPSKRNNEPRYLQRPAR